MQLSSFDYINTYTDSVLENLHDQMVENGMNCTPLPDTTINFSKRRLGVTWKGEAILYDGVLMGLETLHRDGDAKLTLGLESLVVDVGIGIMNAGLNYDVHATFMNHGPRGTITGSLSHVTCDVQLCLVHGSDTVVLDKLTVKEIGQLKARVTGLGTVLNFIASRILQIVGNRVKWKVSSMLEGAIKELLNDIISKTPLPTTLPTSSASFDVTKMFLLA